MSDCHGPRPVIRVDAESVVLGCSCGAEIVLPRCAGLTRKGERCHSMARPGRTTCWIHRAKDELRRPAPPQEGAPREP